MDPNELLEYAVKGMVYYSIGTAGFIFTLIGSNLVFGSTLFRKKIKSQEELVHIVDTEARKLDLDPSRIDAKYNENGVTEDYSRKNGERYELHLVGGCYSTVATVRHELYHILKDCDRFAGRKIPSFYYCFIAEPRATLYEWFGIRL